MRASRCRRNSSADNGLVPISDGFLSDSTAVGMTTPCAILPNKSLCDTIMLGRGMIDRVLTLEDDSIIVGTPDGWRFLTETKALQHSSLPNNFLNEGAEGVGFSLTSGSADLSFQFGVMGQGPIFSDTGVVGKNGTGRVEVPGQIRVR